MTSFRFETTHTTSIEIHNIDIPESDDVNIICNLTCRSMQIFEFIDTWIPKKEIEKAWHNFSERNRINPLLTIEDCDTQNQLELWLGIPENCCYLMWSRTSYGDFDLCMMKKFNFDQVVGIFEAMGFEDPKNKMLE